LILFTKHCGTQEGFLINTCCISCAHIHEQKIYFRF
jgi:hypothetical protein